ncbi:indolepyruvate oxidoreductase subunit beta [Caldivirga sp. UBA161]|uniref:indolepyruvate oxidoreductase subunit beta n=1 Tax=Caldivirga sp. UBA161 TaxID=1915569 RepID=UPI0025B909FA|nr:indolepyruvate oxidoreductase subunit beta [Caldivirga sp. UBA161]
MKLNIYLTGVGGQGLITFASVLGQAAVDSGLKVLVAETHGLSQRGGAVDVHVRLGDVDSPLIPKGGADIIVAFELIEALRALPFANKATLLIINRRLIPPPGLKGSLPRPESIEAEVKGNAAKVYLVDAYDYAVKIGNPVFENMVMLGALHALSRINEVISVEAVEEAIVKVIGKAVSENIKAFRLGRAVVSSS